MIARVENIAALLECTEADHIATLLDVIAQNDHMAKLL